MKKLLLILVLIFSAIMLNAQVSTINPWYKFGKPINERINDITLAKVNKTELKATLPVDSVVKLFSADVQLDAVAYSLNAKPQASTLSSAGLGISWGAYTVGTAYCNYSVNADLLTKVSLNSTSVPGFGISLSIGILNKLVRVGVAYLGNNGFANGNIYALAGVSVSL